MDWSQHLIPGSSEAFYISDFITADEEQHLLRKINETPKQKWKILANRRLQLWGGEVLQNVLIRQEMPSFLNKYPDVIGRLKATGAFASSAHKSPNHVILNEYLPGQGIMPHQDGPSYHPVVATISLGSHTVFHYYRYNSDDSLSSADTTTSPAKGGQVIDSTPILSVFLEPRSAIITTGSLYTQHLHGIEETRFDTFSADGVVSLTNSPCKIPIANWKMVRDEQACMTLHEGGTLGRRARYSLTCRDVEKVASGHPLHKKRV
ncbi:hypothetical protein SERLA73DRAFT_114083 [Serpula lacrymans var. lacrymans S7.3]|uniref:Fe2OG dioxygenase domain-containing protein n=2 Tax=Serpula lacrymans var. lacrymans TaxID=341189 RepID=F8QA50_SERL3|nr:uncharacterized protein SERLADRAFT_452856 [Serpula lacrymans var. lacrymans S7.9]EGN94640.1 hypothetical protein SERLA73DRAFT_114083 [Serpula lacrymans var. lacrymans S7.3]EGO20120.1 hypothetical protein SERLADRAFT_452856 [Serpula lacrymans var. lacrymans S7.9]